MRKATIPLPSVLVLKAEEVQPSLGEAFARWVSVGEWPAGSVLCQFVGTAAGTRREAYRDVATGRLLDVDGRRTLTLVYPPGKKTAPLFIFGPEGS